MKSPIRAIALVSVFLAAVTPAFAQQEEDAAQKARFQWGALRFTPGIVINNIGFDNNVFNDPNHQLGDTTADIGPAINLWTNIGRLRVAEKSSGTYLYFKQYGNQRSWNTANELKLDLPMTRLRPFVIGGYTNVRQRPGFEIDTRIRQSLNLVTLGTDVVLSGRSMLVLSATRSTMAIDQQETFLGSNLADALNRHTDTETLELRYKLTPLTTLVVASDATQDRFAVDRLRNADSIAVRPGFEFKPFALVAGKVSVGFRHFNVLNDRVPDYQGPVANVDVRYTLTTTTQLAATVTRDLAFSYDEATPYYALTNSGVTLTQRLASSWDVIAHGGWQQLGYRAAATDTAGTPREDRGQIYGLGVGYLVGETFRIGLDVNYYQRRSQFFGRNYDGFRAGMSVSYGILQ
jgi:hypothetical protein